METLKEKIAARMKEHTLAVLATVTAEGRPWARYVTVKGDDQLNVWFATFKGSRKVRQICANPEVHLVLGVSDPKSAAHWLQIQGRAEILEDAETKNAVWFDLLKTFFEGPADPNYVVCRIRPQRIEYNTMNSFTPEVWKA
jgi:general stress protein 26